MIDRVCIAALLASVATASAAPPAWLTTAAAEETPAQTAETDAIVLLAEQEVRPNASGEVVTSYRRAVRILRPSGRDQAQVAVPESDAVRLESLRAWAIPPSGKPIEFKERDALVSGLQSGVLYHDAKVKLLRVPGAGPDWVVGFEYVLRSQEDLPQAVWSFQEIIPVRRARLRLRLAPGTSAAETWINHEPIAPVSVTDDGRWFEISDVEPIRLEPAMPAVAALSARLVLAFGTSRRTWDDIASWYYKLSTPSRAASPPIRERVATLAPASSPLLARMQALAGYVQRDVRYVAIQIGIGAYRPHTATETDANRFGDCKDKATLLAAMLGEIGVASDLVLVSTQRGTVQPTKPALRGFNHAILAIHVPQEVDAAALVAVAPRPDGGKWLFFDPTDAMTALGLLPNALQGGHALVIGEAAGTMVELPRNPPAYNRLLRSGELVLGADGALAGSFQEIRRGDLAADLRGRLLAVAGAERAVVLEQFLASFVNGTLDSAEVSNLEDPGPPLILRYRFRAPAFAKPAGDLLLLPARVVGAKTSGILTQDDRHNPWDLGSTSLESDTFRIKLPEGYIVDELPAPTHAEASFAAYTSEVETQDNIVILRRTYTVREPLIPLAQMDQLRAFDRQIAADERGRIVLKRAALVE